MSKRIMFGSLLVTAAIAGGFYWMQAARSEVISIYNEPEFEIVDSDEMRMLSFLERRFPGLSNWVRPDGPTRIGLQVGHWKNAELPDELENLRGKSTGAEAAGHTEPEVALAIAQATKAVLDEHASSVDEELIVDILPATVPPGYVADLFLSIHADGNESSLTSGFKAASPWWDITGKSPSFVRELYETYPAVTGLNIDDNITSRMRGYYAFNWWRYEHSIHPMTPAAIIETGFLTNASDREVIVNQPEIVAQGIADTIIAYLDAY